MKTHPFRRGVVLSAVAGLVLLSSVARAANIIVGTGGTTSYVVLESGNLGVRTYEVRYTAASGQDGRFLLDQVLAGDSSLSMVFINYGSIPAPNFILDSITANSVTETNTGFPTYSPYWAHWVSGGAAGFPTASPVTSGSWTVGSGMSSPYRLIAPGSWDAYVFSDGTGQPSVAPVPETSTLTLAALGALCIVRRRR
jgi:hypothetical protein